MNRLILWLGLLLAGAGASLAHAAVTGEWRVNLVRGSTGVPPASVGATEAAAWAACQARIPRNATAQTPYTCQTPRYVAIVTPDPPPPPPNCAVLRWTPPERNSDGSTLTDLAGYRIQYGTSAEILAQSLQLAVPTATGHRVCDLPRGTYYFAVRAYARDGRESVPTSPIWTKTIL